MPRRLILVPRPRSRLVGSTTITPGYPKPYTPDEMRVWADDLGRYNRTPAAELERWRNTPTDRLSPEQLRTLAAHEILFVDSQAGIRGSLRPDQTVELDGGRHRAGYILERGVDPVPVWVWASESRDLDAFRVQCERDVQSARSALHAREDRSAREPRAEQRRENDRSRDFDPRPENDRLRV